MCFDANIKFKSIHESHFLSCNVPFRRRTHAMPIAMDQAVVLYSLNLFSEIVSEHRASPTRP